ncbi:Bifunctional UDP-N-acetylglucosamine transferase and deubiquitinase [Actinidia chinensis var. chinensis]|uniref:Bifunctional UDP-N-acetylglucosamine transferase and deubiquitinase n=1 Tax=Actinidia chinensis var. chinensis TaxID=1590841 RepID=A0A2R6PDK2_ACTCC|nr:Bifunctional UDP-N-acetylglucosamine transferase and deubiquitinase [Actinidia chinensis var. chinensis]
MTGDPRSIGGLTITNTETIRSFLTAASNDPLLLQDLRKTASDLSTRPSVPYKSLRPVWFGSEPSTRPDLLRLFSGSDFVFASPKPREKSEELKARLRKLEELAERKAYDELVKDITPKKGTDEPFSSYKDQLGLHVVLTMFTGYLVGYAAFRALFSYSPVMNAAGGILGLVCAMLLETLLFIIRSSNQDLRPPSSPSNLKKNQ